MQIYDNLMMLLKQLSLIIYSPLNKLLILACSAQIASMITKLIINSIKAKKITIKTMANYGGMPSSHTVFITSFCFGIALDPKYGWTHPLLAFSIIVSAIVLVDTVRFRGAVDNLNDVLQKISEKNKVSYEEISFPKYIAHKPSEVVGGIIFAFLYSFVFYLFFYNLFPN